jgi:hypothetical protein
MDLNPRGLRTGRVGAMIRAIFAITIAVFVFCGAASMGQERRIQVFDFEGDAEVMVPSGSRRE